MRQCVDVRQPEHRRQSLEAVGGAEHFVEQLRVAIAVGRFLVQALHPLVELQQVLVEAIEQLARLVEEIAQQAVEEFIAGDSLWNRPWQVCV